MVPHVFCSSVFRRLIGCQLAIALAAGLPAARVEAAGYICAEGGGGLAKGHWADGVFHWMIEHGGDRRVIVIGYHADPDKTVERVFIKAGATAVDHLVIADRATADSAETGNALIAADIIWIRGGDQSKYVKQWRGTRTEAAIRAVYARGGVIGGTSAGAAVLGEVIYDAFNGSLTSTEALSNAYHPIVTLTSDFLQLTPGVLFDTHFTERGRLGRLAVMLARRHADAQQDLIGAGLDYRTALCVYPDLTAEVRGEGSVTILHRTPESQETVAQGRPAVVTDLAYTQLTEGYRYDLKNRRVLGRPDSAELVTPGANQRRFYACTLDGADVNSSLFGQWVLTGIDQRAALFNGRIGLDEGAGALTQTLVVARVLADDGFVENRVGGSQWVIAKNPGAMAVLMTEDIVVESSPPAVLAFTGKATSSGSVMILDGAGMTSAAFSTYRNDDSSGGPRQSVAIENARLHLLSNGHFYDANRRVALLLRPSADLTADGTIDRSDIHAFSEFLTGVRAASWQARSIDANQDGRLDREDIAPFVAAALGE